MIDRAAASWTFALLAVAGLSVGGAGCSKDADTPNAGGATPAEAPAAPPMAGGSAAPPSISNMQILVVEAFYKGNPVTYQPEPAEITAARQKAARERIASLERNDVRQIALLLEDENASISEFAARALQLVGAKADIAVPELIKALNRPGSMNRKTRLAAIRALQKVGPAATAAEARLKEIEQNGGDEEEEAARDALLIIATYKESQSGDLASMGAIRDEILKRRPMNPQAMTPKNKTIIQMGESAVPSLVRLYQTDPDAYVRAQAGATLGHLGPAAKAATPALIATLRTGEDMEVMVAADALGKIGNADEKTLTALCEVLKKDDAFAASAAVRALGDFGEKAKPALPQLVEALDNEKLAAHVRSLIAEVLGGWGADAAEAVPALARAAESDQTILADNAIQALGAIGPAAAEATPALIEHVADEQSFSRTSAVVALGKIGPGAKEAIPELEKAEADRFLSGHAAEALALIQAGDPSEADDPNAEPADPATAVARAELFYDKLREGMPAEVRAMLTQKARPHYGDSITLAVPEGAELEFGKAKFKDDVAAVPVTIEVDSNKYRLFLYMRSEAGEWRVYALRETGEDGETVMTDLEEPFDTSFAPEGFQPPTAE